MHFQRDYEILLHYQVDKHRKLQKGADEHRIAQEGAETSRTFLDQLRNYNGSEFSSKVLHPAKDVSRTRRKTQLAPATIAGKQDQSLAQQGRRGVQRGPGRGPVVP